MISVGLSCKDNPTGPHERFEAGPILFVSDKSGTWQLYSMNEDGSDVKQLTFDQNFQIIDARWSPDASKIVYTSLDDRLAGSWREKTSVLYVMNADGTGRYKLTNPPLEAFHYPYDIKPVWSPDGKRIAFSRLMPPEASGEHDIFIIDVNGKNERRITSHRNLLEFVTAFVDDSILLGWYFDYSRRDSLGQGDGKGQIAYLDAKTGVYFKTVSSYEADDDAPILSEDKRYVAFSSLTVKNGVTGRLLHLMAPDGSSRRQLSISLHQYEWPVEWSPDGQRILCMTQDPNSKSVPSDPYSNFPQDILIVNVADGSVRTLTPFPHREAYSRATSWRRR
jgi:Tol biopolymer transport system component